jgi:hypothetical protein
VQKYLNNILFDIYLLLLLFNNKLFKKNLKINNSIDVTLSEKENNNPTVIDDPLQVRSMVTLEDLFN